MRTSKSSGFALLAVMVFLNIFLLLSLMSLRSAFLIKNILQNSWRFDKNEASAHQILDFIEEDFMQKFPPCRIEVMPSSYIREQKRSWWIYNACSGEWHGVRYRFVFESLGYDNCAMVITKNMIADYYRITLMTYPINRLSSPVVLQSTMARLKKPQAHCTEALHQVTIGEQMRRNL